MSDVTKTGHVRAVTAAVIGNVLEWYDFGVYAFVAVIIAKKFFPGQDDAAALLSTFLAYGLGFVARPLGAIVLGRLGDTHGRKVTLLITIFLMAAGTVMIGLLPTYESIGFLAPVLLVVARMMQGFSTGGEWGGSTAFIVEWAPSNRRGLFGSFQQMSVVSGLLLGSATAAILSSILTPQQMADWGWRVPFLLGSLLGPVGLYMRRTIDETPAYKQATSQEPAATGGLGLAARAFGFTIVWTVCFYVLLSFMPTWTQRYLKLPAQTALWANTAGLLVLVVAIPLMGRLSDSIGRKKLLLTCCLAMIIVPFPAFYFLLANGPDAIVLFAVQCLFALFIAMFSGADPAAIAEMFPTRGRSTWMTSGYALSVSIFGGFAPFIAVWMIEQFQNPAAHAGYLIASPVVSIVVIARMKETAFLPLQ